MTGLKTGLHWCIGQSQAKKILFCAERGFLSCLPAVLLEGLALYKRCPLFLLVQQQQIHRRQDARARHRDRGAGHCVRKSGNYTIILTDYEDISVR